MHVKDGGGSVRLQITNRRLMTKLWMNSVEDVNIDLTKTVRPRAAKATEAGSRKDAAVAGNEMRMEAATAASPRPMTAMVTTIAKQVPTVYLDTDCRL